MSFHDHLVRGYRLLHRYNPFRAEVGLFPIGGPGRDSPVLVSGNYAHTVDHLHRVLAGQNVWLLVVDSAGINVWCAAGVGDFNEHKITDAIVACALDRVVDHRRLVLPPLAAVGIDRSRLLRDTGYSVTWGPAHLDDLPAYLGAGCHRDPAMRLARFPLRDRLEMGVGMVGVFAFPLLLLPWWPRQVAIFMGSIVHAVFGTLLQYDRLPPRHPANKTLLLGLAQLLLIFALWPSGKRWGTADSRGGAVCRVTTAVLGLLAHLLIAIDMIGSTPFYKTTIAHWLESGGNASLFQPGLTPACTACGACLEVCPKGIFARGPDRKMTVDLERECCECLACIKQCPHDAIANVGIGFKDDIRSLQPERLARLRAAAAAKAGAATAGAAAAGAATPASTAEAASPAPAVRRPEVPGTRAVVPPAGLPVPGPGSVN